MLAVGGGFWFTTGVGVVMFALLVALWLHEWRLDKRRRERDRRRRGGVVDLSGRKKKDGR